MLLDTNILVHHLTGEQAEQAARATAFLRDAAHLELVALIVAQLVDLLESVYERTRPQVAALARAVLAHPPVLAAESPTGVGSSGPVWSCLGSPSTG